MTTEFNGTFYSKYGKRCLDIVCSLIALLFFPWLYLLLAIILRIWVGSPVIYRQPRPGVVDRSGRETIFFLYKFRSMSEERDENGEYLPDEKRIHDFGRWLRKTGLDEIPEVFNILKGDMSIVGPRPQLVRDMVFMSAKQRLRHTVRPGLTGLAQVNGGNAITWEEKLNWDLKYIEKITFSEDCRIILLTIKRWFSREHMNDAIMAPDYGEELLRTGKITSTLYMERRKEAERLIAEWENEK